VAEEIFWDWPGRLDNASLKANLPALALRDILASNDSSLLGVNPPKKQERSIPGQYRLREREEKRDGGRERERERESFIRNYGP